MPAKILVVDDEPQFERLILQRFRKQIRKEDYAFTFAMNGRQALDIINQDEEIDMVLTDINMPEMDGLTFIQRMKEDRPLLKAVIVSAYGDMQNIRTAMNLGAFDFVTKPIEFGDLETTIQKTLEEAELAQKIKMAQKLEERNTKLEELDELKTRFFTNISHELRTPLTVISGMAEQIEAHPERWLSKGLVLIKRNTFNLLNLVKQILDLRKLESGKMELQLTQKDLIPFLNYLSESFQSLAESRDIQLHFLKNEGTLIMDFDPEKLQRIIVNLLGNAVKYTAEGGDVYLLVDKLGETLQLRVKDTGIGIPASQLPYVFDRFFRAEEPHAASQEGTGIGLSLVRELVKLMEGTIEVESQEGVGTTFTIKLPIKRTAPVSSSTEDQQEQLPAALHERFPQGATTFPNPPTENAELPNLLIIEDNPDVAQYLYACLEGHYRLALGQDGEEGINKALEQVPDIIVSDVMMPKKDGFEVCQALKQDDRTSHIPIVLLTAKADVESRIAGLEHGADAYLAKPFDKKELLVRLEKLLELRDKLRARYTALDALGDKNNTNPQPEDEFVMKLRSEVEANIEDEDFGILQLCRAVGMSRTQLHRKIKALTGKSTSIFVRAIRLQKAKELLEQTDLNISQVAFEVGFKDPKYFSRTFAEEFGESPNQMRK